MKSPALAFRKGPRPVQNQKAPVTIWLQDIFGNRLPCFFSRGKPHCSTSFCFSPMLICTKSICLLQFLNLAGHLKPPSPGTDTGYILHLFFPLQAQHFDNLRNPHSCKSNRPHPYQAPLELFSNYLLCFMAISAPIRLLSAAL